MNQKVDDSSCYVSEMFNSDQVLEKSNITRVDGFVNAHLGKGKIVDSLNVSNSYSVAAILEMGYESCVISDECDKYQVEEIMKAFSSRYHFELQSIRLYTKTTLDDDETLSCKYDFKRW